MRRGPHQGAQRVDFVAKAEEAWAPAPDWVRRVAEECNRSSQSAVAKRLNYSAGTISQVLSASYPGNLRGVEEMVRGALMAATVDCPAKGEMGRDECLRWQAKPFYPSSSDRVRMYHACRRGCPHSKHTKETTDA